jgi:Zn finger protein HypA/HybF involved in hydrogenase expression
MEPELEVQAEQAQAKSITNLALDQGKLRCITSQFLTFIFKCNIFMLRMIVH